MATETAVLAVLSSLMWAYSQMGHESGPSSLPRERGGSPMVPVVILVPVQATGCCSHGSGANQIPSNRSYGDFGLITKDHIDLYSAMRSTTRVAVKTSPSARAVVNCTPAIRLTRGVR